MLVVDDCKPDRCMRHVCVWTTVRIMCLQHLSPPSIRMNIMRSGTTEQSRPPPHWTLTNPWSNCPISTSNTRRLSKLAVRPSANFAQKWSKKDFWRYHFRPKCFEITQGWMRGLLLGIRWKKAYNDLLYVVSVCDLYTVPGQPHWQVRIRPRTRLDAS